MKYLLLAGILLGALPGRAQFVADPARATAARDTLFREAQLLRQAVQQRTAFFEASPRNRFARRVVVSGKESAAANQDRYAPRISWEQVTRYRRNGRVQQTFRAKHGGVVLLEEQRLNGRVLWLWLPPVASKLQIGTHVSGRYYDSGYLVLGRTEYALPPSQ